MGANHSSLSVVLSFRNEEENLSELIHRLHKSLQPLGLDYEFVFVNDASTDGSLELLTAKSKEDCHVKIINMSRRFGGGECLLAGMKYSQGDAVVFMDTDLQDPPEVIPQLVERWREGAEVVYTTRLTRDGENAFKMWVTKLAYRFLRKVSDVDLPVDSGDFKLLSRRVVSELVKMNEPDPFLRGLVPWVGFKQVPVLYHREKRFAGETHFPLYRSGPVKAFLCGLTSFSHVPLHFLLVVGLVTFFAGSLFLAAVFGFSILQGAWQASNGMMAMILFLGGGQLLGIGILALYLGRIYREVRKRPNYIIESRVGFEEGSQKQNFRASG
jgi:dolichol-phosphate mannosyltransferase